MSSVQEPHLHLEVGNILFLDIVGYSKLLSDEQKELVQELNQIVRETEQFCTAEAEGKLTRLPTGDGMVLVFTNNPEAMPNTGSGFRSLVFIQISSEEIGLIVHIRDWIDRTTVNAHAWYFKFRVAL